MLTGQIESATYEGNAAIYARYAFAHGDDWRVLRGVEEGITQMATPADSSANATCNFPVDISFKASCVFGWPQIVISVYGEDYFGRPDMILGYGAVHVPLAPGRHVLEIKTFRPLSSTLVGRFKSWLFGLRPEFVDSLFPSKAEGRDVTRVQSFGSVKVVLDVTLQGMERLGYSVPPATSAVRLANPLVTAE